MAAAYLKVNNKDATIRYGSYELPLLKPPLDFRTINAPDHEQTAFRIKVTVGQPRQKA